MRVFSSSVVMFALVAWSRVGEAKPQPQTYAIVDLSVDTDDRPENVCVLAKNDPKCSGCTKGDATFASIDTSVVDAGVERRWRSKAALDSTKLDCSDERVCQPEIVLSKSELDDEHVICSRSDGSLGPGRVLYLKIDHEETTLTKVSFKGTRVELDFAKVPQPFDVAVIGGDYVQGRTMHSDVDNDGAQTAPLTLARRCATRTALLPARDDGWQGKAKVELVDSSQRKLLSCETSVAGRSFDVQIPARPDGQLKSMAVTPIAAPDATANQSWSLGAEWTSSLPAAPLELGWTRLGFAWDRSCYVPRMICPDVTSAQRADCHPDLSVTDARACHYVCDAKSGTLLRVPMDLTLRASILSAARLQWKASLDAGFQSIDADPPEDQRVLLVELPQDRSFREIRVWIRDHKYLLSRAHQPMAQWEQPRVVAEENGVVPIRGEWGCGDNVEYSYGGRVLDVAQYTQVDDGVIRLHKAVGVLQVDLGVEMAQMFRSLAGFTRQATDPTASAWQIGPRLRILAGNLHSQTGRRFVQIQWGFPVMSYQTSTDARTVSYVSSYLLLGYAWEQQLGPMWFRAFAQAGPQMADRRLAGSIDADFQLAIDAGLVVDFDLAYVRHFHLGFSVRPTIGQELYDRVGTDTIHDRSFPYGLTIDLGWEP